MSNLVVSTQQVAMQEKKQPTKPQVQQKPQESVSFFDEKWSGYQIAKLTGDNDFTDWLQNKDKVCTDGKDDGKIGLWEGVKSFGKGLIGGIPKAMINHPVASTIAIGAGAVATAVAGTAILEAMTILGLSVGIVMAVFGGYNAAKAKTDGEAKQALETCGMGVTTTALSIASLYKIENQTSYVDSKTSSANNSSYSSNSSSLRKDPYRSDLFFEDISPSEYQNIRGTALTKYINGHEYRGHAYQEMGYQKYDPPYIRWQRVD